MNPDLGKYFEDIILSINAIEHHIQNLNTLSDYQDDITVIDAVERRLAIIVEAMFKANKIDSFLKITDKQKIISLRHVLVHEYDLIEDSTIWNIVHKNLPLLKTEVSELIKFIN